MRNFSKLEQVYNMKVNICQILINGGNVYAGN